MFYMNLGKGQLDFNNITGDPLLFSEQVLNSYS